MYRERGRPDLVREEAAIHDLALRVHALRKRSLALVIAASIVAGTAAVVAVAQIGGEGAMQVPGATGKVLGGVFAFTMFASMVAGYRLSLELVVSRSEAWARKLAVERKCELEPLLEAARLFAGGKPS
jgi:hypothetical protein